jgi:hypothetical protein
MGNVGLEFFVTAASEHEEILVIGATEAFEGALFNVTCALTVEGEALSHRLVWHSIAGSARSH